MTARAMSCTVNPAAVRMAVMLQRLTCLGLHSPVGEPTCLGRQTDLTGQEHEITSAHRRRVRAARLEPRQGGQPRGAGFDGHGHSWWMMNIRLGVVGTTDVDTRGMLARRTRPLLPVIDVPHPAFLGGQPGRHPVHPTPAAGIQEHPAEACTGRACMTPSTTDVASTSWTATTLSAPS